MVMAAVVMTVIKEEELLCKPKFQRQVSRYNVHINTQMHICTYICTPVYTHIKAISLTPNFTLIMTGNG